MKKDPGIPNLFPYKEKILHEIEEKKRLREEEIAKKREEAKARKSKDVTAQVQDDDRNGSSDREERSPSLLEDDEEMDEQNDSATANPMSALLASARARAAAYDEEPVTGADEMDEDDVDEEDTRMVASSGAPSSDPSRKAYTSIFASVLDASDVVLYVLDARDPNNTRSIETERQITAAAAGSKRLILILNKIDLVPPPVLKAWLVYLRRYFPTLPLRASTPAPNARTFDHKSMTVKGTSEALLRALKSYAASKQLKRAVTVGIVGYPNVGKSSVINALTSRLGSSRNTTATVACPTGAEAGLTTSLREVKLDGKLKLLDSPGIVFASPTTSSDRTDDDSEAVSNLTPKQHTQANLTLLSALPPSAIRDPLPAITLLLHRLSKSEETLASLCEQYDISPSTLVRSRDTGDLTTDFLIQVARKRGRLGKGGVPNLQSAAMGVIVDWRDGRIRGWVEAPREDVAESVAGKKVVSEWAEEFKLDGLWGDGVPGGEGDRMVE